MSRIAEALNKTQDAGAQAFDAAAVERAIQEDVKVFAGGSKVERAPIRPVAPVPAPQGGTERSPVPAAPVFHGFAEPVSERLVISRGIPGQVAEQYRTLAATLHHAQAERGIKTVVVASALPGEGKTLTATNVALTLSESFQRRVLLVEADLRRPALHALLQVPNVWGLSDGLRSPEENKFPLMQVSPFLFVLLGGRPDADPVGGLSSDRMRRVIAEAAANFDWVIVDTPPAALLPDADLVCRNADGALLVIQAGATPYPAIQRAINALGQDRILGVVLNRMASARLDDEGSYYADAHYWSGEGTGPDTL